MLRAIRRQIARAKGKPVKTRKRKPGPTARPALISLNSKTKYPHKFLADAEGLGYLYHLANPACRHCHGCGYFRWLDTGRRPFHTVKTVLRGVVCSCVVRAMLESENGKNANTTPGTPVEGIGSDNPAPPAGVDA